MSDARQTADTLEAYQRTIETLKERLRFETLLSDLAMAFYATTPAEVDAQIRARLGDLRRGGSAAGLGRCSCAAARAVGTELRQRARPLPKRAAARGERGAAAPVPGRRGDGHLGMGHRREQDPVVKAGGGALWTR